MYENVGVCAVLIPQVGFSHCPKKRITTQTAHAYMTLQNTPKAACPTTYIQGGRSPVSSFFHKFCENLLVEEYVRKRLSNMSAFPVFIKTYQESGAKIMFSIEKTISIQESNALF